MNGRDPASREAVPPFGAPGGHGLPNVNLPQLGSRRSLIKIIALDIEKAIPTGAIILERNLSSQLH